MQKNQDMRHDLGEHSQLLFHGLNDTKFSHENLAMFFVYKNTLSILSVYDYGTFRPISIYTRAKVRWSIQSGLGPKKYMKYYKIN